MRAVLLALAFALLSLAVLAVYTLWPNDPLPQGTRADRIIVDKSKRTLVLMNKDTVLREYRIALGVQPVGAKEAEGDGKTPEGLYLIDYRNPSSKFHLSLHISYPRPEQIARAKRQGVSPGGMIMIHGLADGTGWLGKFHWLVDWTNGCIAVSNAEIEEIWRVVPDGTPIDIRP